jgi:gas vesicle protein
MAKGNTLKFLEGTVVGITLGVAASIFLALKKGKISEEDIVDVTADFFKYISPKVKKVKKMGEKQYKLFMKNAVKQYAKTKKISDDKARQLMENAQQSWKHFSSHLGK